MQPWELALAGVLSALPGQHLTSHCPLPQEETDLGNGGIISSRKLLGEEARSSVPVLGSPGLIASPHKLAEALKT